MIIIILIKQKSFLQQISFKILEKILKQKYLISWMRNLMYNDIANAYQNLFLGVTVIVSLKCLVTLCRLKQAPRRVLKYIFMI